MHQLQESGSVSGSTLNITGGKSYSAMENSRLVLVALLVVLCCSLVAVVLAAVALTKNNESPNINVGSMPSGSSAPSAAASPIVISTGGSGSAGGSGAGGKRTFTVAIGHDWGAHNYFDEEGYITGFSKDLIATVCEAAGVDCRTVWDKWTNCWDSSAGEHSMGGKGLFARWYDGCMGWAKSVNRMQTFAFGVPYLRMGSAQFYIKKGTPFDPMDITGKKIGFMDGWVFDEKCIARQSDIKGNHLPLDKIVHFEVLQDAVTSVLNGSIDAVTGDPIAFGEFVTSGQFVVVGDFPCYLHGSTMMTRKDNDFLTYWNDGFAKIQSSGKFKKLCDEAEKTHGDKGGIYCI